MKKETWIRLVGCESLMDFPEEKSIEMTFPNQTIGLLRRGEKLLAFAAKCPHAGAALCDGRVDARGHLVCPLHQYRFDPVRGYNSSGEGYKLKTFPVEIREEGIFVLLPDS